MLGQDTENKEVESLPMAQACRAAEVLTVPYAGHQRQFGGWNKPAEY